MKILALDASTEACSVALWLDGDVRERFELGGQHSERILPMVDVLLAEAGIKLAQLEALAFGRGPGSFTGLRIAAGVAQGLAFGANLPVVPVSSLAVLAQGQDAVLVAARDNEVFRLGRATSPRRSRTRAPVALGVEDSKAAIRASPKGRDRNLASRFPHVRAADDIGCAGKRTCS